MFVHRSAMQWVGRYILPQCDHWNPKISKLLLEYFSFRLLIHSIILSVSFGYMLFITYIQFNPWQDRTNYDINRPINWQPNIERRSYPERLRDRPCEASTTWRKPRCQFRQNDLEDERLFFSELTQPLISRRGFLFSWMKLDQAWGDFGNRLVFEDWLSFDRRSDN